MAAKEEVPALLEQIPGALQREVADSARFLLGKRLSEELAWWNLSLAQAARDLPKEDYTEADLRGRW